MISKKSIAVALGCALALGTAGAASAAIVNVGGVTLDTSNPLDLQIQSINLRETSISKVGDVLIGYGQVGSIDGNTGFCVGTGGAGCNLTFTFSYTVSGLGTASGLDPLQIVFSNGSLNFFVNNTTSGSGAYNVLNPTSASFGTPWVTMAGVTTSATGFALPGQLFSTITGSPSDPTGGSGGFGLMNVSGGMAASALSGYRNLATGGEPGDLANFSFNSTFLTDGSQICGPMTAGGQSLCFPIGGTATLSGRVPVPEPSELGLMGLGLGLLSFLFLRRRREASDHV